MNETEIVFNYLDGATELTPFQEKVVYNLHKALQWKCDKSYEFTKVTRIDVTVYDGRSRNGNPLPSVLVFVKTKANFYLEWSWTLKIGSQGGMEWEYSIGGTIKPRKRRGDNLFWYHLRQAEQAIRVGEWVAPELIITESNWNVNIHDLVKN